MKSGIMFLDYGLAEPEYEIMSGGMAVTVFGLNFEAESQKENVDNSAESYNETVEKTVEKIIEIIKENPHTTMNELVKSTGLSRRGIEWNIQQLKAKGLLKRIGADKGGYWKVQ